VIEATGSDEWHLHLGRDDVAEQRAGAARSGSSTQSIVFGYGFSDHGSTVRTEDAPLGRQQERPGGRGDVVEAMAVSGS
jgi:hypothetical protein